MNLSNKTSLKSPSNLDANAMWKIPYGMYLVTAQDGRRDNGCIVNTVSQVTESPLQISIAINKSNLTHDMIHTTRLLAISILTESTPFSLFEHFGFVSGRDKDKFNKSNMLDNAFTRTTGGLYRLLKYTNAVIVAKVVSSIDCGTHSIFIAEVILAEIINNEVSCSYEYYLTNIKPKPEQTQKGHVSYICKICGYVYNGENLPDDFICPWCKHGVADFEQQ